MNNPLEDISIENVLLDLEILIGASVSRVWTQWIDMASWVTSHTIEHVSGEIGSLGLISRASFRHAAEMGYPAPHYHYNQVLKVIPERQYTFKTYSEAGGSYGLRMLGFDDARFIVVDDKTKVTFRFYGEYKTEIPRDPLKTSSGDGNHMMRNLENLKRIVEGRLRT